MKKTILNLSLVLLSFVFITACGKKDDKNTAPQKSSVSLDSKSVSLHYD